MTCALTQRQSRARSRLPITDTVPRGREATSREAFDGFPEEIRSGDQRDVYQYIAEHGPCTCDEFEQASGMLHQTASARFNDLKRYGVIVKSGLRLPTRSGRKADAYIVAAGEAQGALTL
jgi:hypothetical protein